MYQIILNRDGIRRPHLKELRNLAQEDLDEATYRILEDTVSYLQSNPDQTIDPTTYQAYLFYKEERKGL